MRWIVLFLLGFAGVMSCQESSPPMADEVTLPAVLDKQPAVAHVAEVTPRHCESGCRCGADCPCQQAIAELRKQVADLAAKVNAQPKQAAQTVAAVPVAQPTANYQQPTTYGGYFYQQPTTYGRYYYPQSACGTGGCGPVSRPVARGLFGWRR